MIWGLGASRRDRAGRAAVELRVVFVHDRSSDPTLSVKY